MTDSLERLTLALAQRYRVERAVGSGGMATVYLAEDLRHRRRVAVKVLRPELTASLGAERFLREIEVAAKLQHPNILPLLDSGDVDGMLYYVMPFVDGPSLRDRMAERPLPIHDVVRVLAQVVDALAEAHRHGIVHRDVKPDNVMLSGRHALVTDFGVAKAVNQAAGATNLTTVGVALGTPAYMAPEQAAADANVDHRADIYAVGVMAYELLTRSLPFEGENAQAVLVAHISREPQRLRSRNSAIPLGLEAIILKCLAKQPSARWASADELLRELTTFQTPSGGITSPRVLIAVLSQAVRRPSVAVSLALGIIVVGIASVSIWNHRASVRWVAEVAIPQIDAYADSGDWEGANALARRVRQIAPRNHALAELWPRFSWLISIPSDPPGAKVFRRAYAASDDQWEELGTTPLDSVRFPFGYSVVRFELPGRAPLIRALGWPTDGAQSLTRLLPFKLDVDKDLPVGMVRVPGQPPEVVPPPEGGTGFDDLFLGRYEVTNREFKEFVTAGGYQKRDLWEHRFIKAGREIAWADAMALFTDKTGRPGPSTWEAGDYPDGHGDYPVNGVSWYEAAAYAKFTGKELPTVDQWRFALGGEDARWIWPASILDADGPSPVGKSRAITWSGAYDMVGNVREWVFNARGDERMLLGGAWPDESAFFDPSIIEAHLPPIDRSATSGFRLAITRDDSATRAKFREPVVARPARDVSKEPAVSDEAFELLKRMYAYDPLPLSATIESADTTRLWIRQRISFDAAYGLERMLLYLYLPRTGTPPYQTLVYYPGAPAFFFNSIEDYRTIHLDFVLKSGRALAFPVYLGSFERKRKGVSNRQLRVFQTNDLRRTIDYLTTRSDIDTTRLAYYGYSEGGAEAPTKLVLEPRLRAAVLNMAGFYPGRRRFPETEPATFVSRVRVPVIMFSGTLDDFFVLETLAKPFFQMLGTPEKDKKLVIADGSHFVPRSTLIRQTLDWLDRYLGPVR